MRVTAGRLAVGCALFAAGLAAGLTVPRGLEATAPKKAGIVIMTSIFGTPTRMA